MKQVDVSLGNNVLRSIAVLLNDDRLNACQTIIVRYELNSNFRKLEIEVDQVTIARLDDPVKQVYDMIKGAVLEDLASLVAETATTAMLRLSAHPPSPSPQ